MPFGALKLEMDIVQQSATVALVEKNLMPFGALKREGLDLVYQGCQSDGVEKNLMPFGALKPTALLEILVRDLRQVEKNLMPFGALKPTRTQPLQSRTQPTR